MALSTAEAPRLTALGLADPGFDPRAVERIAFVTPPGPVPVTRDFYCTSSSKGRYYWHQLDLWIQGAYLKDVADVRLFEGVGRHGDEMLRDLRAYAPGLIVVLAGGFTIEADAAFVDRMSAEVGASIVVGGESVYMGWNYWSRHAGVVALMNSFAGDGLRALLLGEEGGTGFHFKGQAASASSAGAMKGGLRWGLPPAHWDHGMYRYPMMGRPFASVLTAHGCPFRCSYCNNNRDVLGVQTRDSDDLFAELDHWAAAGVRWLHMRDVNFGGPAARAKEILRQMVRRQYDFRWACFLRPELIDTEMADLLHDAGCVQVQMGVESANQVVLDQVLRRGRQDKVREAFAALDHRGIRRGAHFVLGLPGESAADVEATSRLAVELDPDYASFNVGIRRGGTNYAGADGFGDCSDPAEGQLIGQIGYDRIVALQRQAIRGLYLRPAYARRVVRMLARQPQLFSGIVADGTALVLKSLRPGGKKAVSDPAAYPAATPSKV